MMEESEGGVDLGDERIEEGEIEDTRGGRRMRGQRGMRRSRDWKD